MITILGNQMLFQNDEQRFTVGDTNTTSRLFRLNRYEPDRNDISGLTFRLDLEYPTGEKNTALLTKTVQEESIILLWEITKNDFPMEGSVFINIRGVDAQGVMRWNTARAVVFVEGTTNTPGSWDGNLSELEAMEKAISDVLDSEAGRKAAETERKTAEAERKEAEAARSKDVEDNTAARHTHGNKDALDSITAEKIQKWDAGGGLTPEQEQEIRENTAARHTHTNAQTLNKVTEKMLADAEANTAARHSHTNADVLDGITAEQVQKWNKGVGALEYENLSSYIGAKSWVEENGEFTATVKVDVKKLTLVIVESVHEYYAVTAEAGISADEGYVDGSSAVNLRAARRPKADILINITMLKGIAVGNTTFTVIDCLPKDSGEAAPAASTAFSDHVLSANAWNSTPEGFFVNNDKHFGCVLPKGTLGYVTAPKTATKEEYDRIAKARLFIHTVNDETETRIVFCAWEKPNADIRLRVSMIKTGNGEQAPMFLNCVHGGGTGGGLTPEQEQAIRENTAARHSHMNSAVLNDITAERVQKWDAGGGIAPEKLAELEAKGKLGEIYVGKTQEFLTAAGAYEIPEGYFRNWNIGKIEIAEGFTKIGKNAFEGCGNLTTVILPSTLKEIGDGAFKTGAKEIYLHSETAPSVGTGVFSAEDKFFVPKKSVDTYIYKRPNAGGWRGTDVNTDNVFGADAIEKSRHTEIFVPCLETFKTADGGGYKIPDYYFYGDDTISRIEIAEGITEIGAYAFSNCINATDIIMPSTIKRIGDCVFAGDGTVSANYGTENIILRAVTPPAWEVEPFDMNADVKLHVPAESVQAYKDAGMIIGRGEVLPIPEGDAPSGGEKEWELLREVKIPTDPASDTSGIVWTVDEQNRVKGFEFDTDTDGQAISYKEIFVECVMQCYENTGDFKLIFNKSDKRTIPLGISANTGVRFWSAWVRKLGDHFYSDTKESQAAAAAFGNIKRKGNDFYATPHPDIIDLINISMTASALKPTTGNRYFKIWGR